MASRLDWDRARDRDRARRKPKGEKRKPYAVHPNSMAARKWGRTTWR